MIDDRVIPAPRRQRSVAPQGGQSIEDARTSLWGLLVDGLNEGHGHGVVAGAGRSADDQDIVTLGLSYRVDSIHRY